jgi:cytidine deaminase
MTELTKEENKFIERVKKRKFRKGGSFVLSEKDNIYHGIPFEVGSKCIHGEENALGAMVTEEGIGTKLKIILVIGSTEDIVMPCGMRTRAKR